MEKNNFSYAKRIKIFAIPILTLMVIVLISLISANPTPPLTAYQTYIYDDYSGTINNTLWSNSSTGVSANCYAAESVGNYIQTYCSRISGNNAGTSTVTSLLLPPLDYIENITLFIHSNSGQGSGGISDITSTGNLFGILSGGSSAPTNHGGTQSYDANWTLIRNYTAGTNYFNYFTSYISCTNGPCSPGTTNGTSQASNNQITMFSNLPAFSNFFSGTTILDVYIINYTMNNRIITVNSIYPPDNSIFSNDNITFNGSAITNNYNTGWNTLVNMSLYIDGIVNQTFNITGKGATNYSLFNVTGIPLGRHIWSIQACDDSNTCTNSVNRTLDLSYLNVISQNYTNPVYETSAQYFEINVQFDTALYSNAYAYIVYDGVTYISNINKAVVGNNVKYSTYVDMPITNISTTKFFHWLLYSNSTTVQNSTTTNQTVNPITFSICGGPGGSHAFINMVYLDENTLAPVNLSVLSSTWNYWLGNGTTYEIYYYNSGGNLSFNNSFCFTPTSIPSNLLFSSVVYQYGINGLYPPRTFQTNVLIPPYLSLTNLSTTQNLYTLSVYESSSITIQVIDQSSASVIPGATVTITRNVAGNNVQVFSGLTDGAGTASVWLSTSSTYTITAYKSGCGTYTASIVPGSNGYNIQLNCAGNLTKFVSNIDGVTYVRTPADGVTTDYGNVFYEYRVISVVTPMSAAKFQLVDQEGNIVATNETLVNQSYSFCTGTSCSLTLSYNSVCGDNIKGRYYINMGNVSNNTYILLEGDALWRFICINKTNSQQSFSRFFDNFNTFFYQWSAGGQAGTSCRIYTNKTECNAATYCKWVDYTGFEASANLCTLRDDYNKAEFSRILLIFFGMVIVLFIMGKTTGYEMTNPGSFLMFMTGGIIILSFGGMFRFVGATPWPFFDQWIYAFICLGFSVGYNVAIVRRYSA